MNQEEALMVATLGMIEARDAYEVSCELRETVARLVGPTPSDHEEEDLVRAMSSDTPPPGYGEVPQNERSTDG